MEAMVMSEILRRFYSGKKIFLTGHTGFKGCWLALWLKELGADVTGYALPPPQRRESLHWLVDGDHGCSSIYGDIVDYDSLRAAVEKCQPDIVFHLAAQALVRQSYADPLETYRTNVMGTVHLFEALRHLKKRPQAIVNVTTDKCYRNDGGATPFKESDPLGGYDPYSSSKAASEIVSDAYRHSFFGNSGLATARAGNVIGGGDFAADRIIPDLIEAIIKKNPATIRSPRAIRPWQHVLDVSYGYLLLAMKLAENPQAYAKGYNFGPADRFIPVKELADGLIKAIGQGEYAVDEAQATVYEAPVLRLNPALAEAELGWKMRYSIDTALEQTALWYKAYLERKQPMKDVTINHINHYMQEL